MPNHRGSSHRKSNHGWTKVKDLYSMYFAYTPSAPQSHPYPHQLHPYLHTPTSDLNHHGKIMISSIPVWPDFARVTGPSKQLSPQGPRTPHQQRESVTSPSSKRKRNDENMVSSLPVFTKKTKCNGYCLRWTPEDKLGVVFAVLKDVNWTLGDLFYHLFRYQDQDGNPVHHSPRHASYINQFLNGTSGKGFGFILDTWMHPMEGGPRSDETEQPTEFTMSVPFQNICSARPALTSFTAQLIKKKLMQEVEAAVQPTSGLHTSYSHQVSWADIGTTTMLSIAKLIQKYQPLTWELVMEICSRPPRKRDGIVVEQKKRPVLGVRAFKWEYRIEFLKVELLYNLLGSNKHHFTDGLLTK